MRFYELAVGDVFNWIGPNGNASFHRWCNKTSSRTYMDDRGMKYNVGTINAEVYHVNRRRPRKPYRG